MNARNTDSSGPRPRVIALVLFMGLGCITILLLLNSRAFRATLGDNGVSPFPGPRAESKAPPVRDEVRSSETPTAARADPGVVAVPSPAIRAQDSEADEDSAPDEQVARRVAEVEDLAMNDDGVSLSTILSELRNPSRTIRAAALEATVQFADRAAVPYLEELAAQTENREEKVELLEAAEYLMLPSLTEYLAARKARSATNQTSLPSRR